MNEYKNIKDHARNKQVYFEKTKVASPKIQGTQQAHLPQG